MKNIIKKITAAALSLSMLFALTACGGEATSGSQVENATYKVAIVKQMDHPSLDEIANAVAAELDAIESEGSVDFEYEIYSGQGDQSVLMQIGNQAVADGVDAIIPIATTAAQVIALCAEEAKIPVIFAAVSDPAKAELVDIDHVTGVSDALNTEFIMNMMLAQNPDVKNVGLLYSLSEPNSATPIAEAKDYLDAKGITYTEATANTNDEVIAAANTLVAQGVDAVFTPTDNIIMSAELAIYESLIAAGIPHYTGADSFVRSGAFTTCGVNYTELGGQAARLAYQAMTEGMTSVADDFVLAEGGIITVNTETAAALNIDYNAVFGNMGPIVEVTTSAD
ncbi:MAG: ABC transporter [Oscillospiraceae bacterium]|nr:ABC transporter [Oscillospiraceae bacterium]